MNAHERYMKMAIELAKKGEGRTSPNPLVGAIIVKSGNVVGKGYHKKAGMPHAEVNALKEAGRRAKGAVVYVTLEPCDHFGRTPPCTDALIRSGVSKVIIGMVDPNPINRGSGIRKLKRCGIMTEAGILEKEAIAINKAYIKFITHKMPYVTVKVAQSLDGKIATKTGESRWITSERSRRYVHQIRAGVDAVMVGVNTVIKDDPSLISTVSKEKQPVRVIVDSVLRTPLHARIFSGISRSRVLIVTTRESRRARLYRKRGAEVIVVKAKKGKVDLRELMGSLAERDMTHILVEGGGELIAGLLEDGLIDRFLFFIAPAIIGGRDAVTAIEGTGISRIGEAQRLKEVTVRRFGEDILIEGEIRR